MLPSSKLIITIEDKDYMVGMREKLIEIKQFYKNLNLSSSLAGRC